LSGEAFLGWAVSVAMSISLNTSAIFKVTVHLSRWEAATMPERRLLHVVRSPGRFVYLRDAARSVPSDLARRVNSPAQIIRAGSSLCILCDLLVAAGCVARIQAA